MTFSEIEQGSGFHNIHILVEKQAIKQPIHHDKC